MILGYTVDKAILISSSTVFKFSFVFVLLFVKVEKEDLHS